MKIKTSNLTGAALNWAVAKCDETYVVHIDFDAPCGIWRVSQGGIIKEYSTDWAQGGPIIEQEGISFFRCEDEYGVDSRGYTTSRRIPVYGAVIGEYFGTGQQRNSYGESWGEIYYIGYELVTLGPTALIAAMRCCLARKLGDEVEIPKELL